MLAACADGILPKEELPVAAGPPPAFPSLSASSLMDRTDPTVLTDAERAAIEEELSKLAKEREIRVKRRIERDPKN